MSLSEEFARNGDRAETRVRVRIFASVHQRLQLEQILYLPDSASYSHDPAETACQDSFRPFQHGWPNAFNTVNQL